MFLIFVSSPYVEHSAWLTDDDDDSDKYLPGGRPYLLCNEQSSIWHLPCDNYYSEPYNNFMKNSIIVSIL